MKKTIPALLIAFCVTALCTSVAWGGDLLRESAAALRRASAQLERIEQREDAHVVAGEIKVAKTWIERGFALLGKGRHRRAAILAERLPAQMSLIRAILSAWAAQQEAVRAQEDLDELERKLKLVQIRYDRLLLLRKGANLTLAYPRGEDALEN
jgi:primosomal protein N''